MHLVLLIASIPLALLVLGAVIGKLLNRRHTDP
jgi:hypothetical protein